MMQMKRNIAEISCFMPIIGLEVDICIIFMDLLLFYTIYNDFTNLSHSFLTIIKSKQDFRYF